MTVRLAIVTDPVAMTVTVGPMVFTTPQLIRRPEVDRTWKRQIVAGVDGDELPLKDMYKAFAAHLGAKFNRRFQAANYWLWIGSRMLQSTGNMLRLSGLSWRQYDPQLVLWANEALPYVNEAEQDELHHLIPAIVIFGAHPSEIRKRLGPATWRRIAANSKTRNMRIMQVAGSTYGKDQAASQDRFVRLLDCPSGILPAIGRALHDVAFEDEMLAARLSPRKTVRAYDPVRTLVNDTRRMGVEINPEWKLARLTREHDEAARNTLRKRYSSVTFAEPWQFSWDGFTAALLTSQLDIAGEGATQHHCVASYASMAAKGHYAVLAVTGPERATVGLAPVTRGWRTEQIYGACNMPVSDRCKAFAEQAARQYSLRDLDIARRAA